jgi:hypothetical protein
MFFRLECISSVINQRTYSRCHHLLPPPPRLRINTERILYVLGMNTRKLPRHIFIPSNITIRVARNMPHYIMTTSWYFVSMSPKSQGGTVTLAGLPRIAPILMATSMFEPEKNTRYKEIRRSSRILANNKLREIGYYVL